MTPPVMNVMEKELLNKPIPSTLKFQKEWKTDLDYVFLAKEMLANVADHQEISTFS